MSCWTSASGIVLGGSVLRMTRPARAGPAPDRAPRHPLFGELVHQRARQDEVEELIDLLHERRLQALPGGPPEEGEDLDRGEQGPAPIGELRRRDRRSERVIAEWDDLDRVCGSHLRTPPSPESYEARAGSTPCSPPANIPRPSPGRRRSG